MFDGKLTALGAAYITKVALTRLLFFWLLCTHPGHIKFWANLIYETGEDKGKRQTAKTHYDIANTRQAKNTWMAAADELCDL